MQKYREHQLTAQLKCVMHAAEELLEAFPNPTGLRSVENLRQEVELLHTLLYCPFCGVDELAFPDHVEKCPHCGGKLHWMLDTARCEDCEHIVVPMMEETLLESESE